SSMTGSYAAESSIIGLSSWLPKFTVSWLTDKSGIGPGTGGIGGDSCCAGSIAGTRTRNSAAGNRYRQHKRVMLMIRFSHWVWTTGPAAVGGGRNPVCWNEVELCRIPP